MTKEIVPLRNNNVSYKNTLHIYTVKKYEASQKLIWDAFVASAKNATFLFRRDFMDYHQDRFIDGSLMVYKNEELFAILPASRKESQLISHGGLTYGSFVLQPSAKLLDSFKAFKKVLAFLSAEGIAQLEIRVIPSFYNIIPSDELEYFLFKAEAKLSKRDAIMAIDFAHELGFQKNRREGINKAKRHGLTIKIEDTCEAFWNEILVPNLKNKYDEAPVHTLAEIESLAKKFPQHIKQVNAYKEDKIVAGTTVFLTKTTIHPQYVSANADKNAFGSLDFLYDFVIREFKEGRRYFDFNTSSEENGKLLNSGLIFWKESCGARTFTCDTYVVDTAKHHSLTIETL